MKFTSMIVASLLMLAGCGNDSGDSESSADVRASCEFGGSETVTLTKASDSLQVTVEDLAVPPDVSLWFSVVVWDADFKKGALLEMRFYKGKQSGYQVANLSDGEGGITDLDDAVKIEGDSITGTFPNDVKPLDSIDIAHWNAFYSRGSAELISCPQEGRIPFPA